MTKSGKYARSLEGKYRREYKKWLSMFDRCTRESIHKRQPSYAGCTVAPEFHNFDYFVDWCNSQPGFVLPDAQLDKDILKRGNKVYGPDTCVFVPRCINQVVNRRGASRGALPVGVTLAPNGGSRPYIAQCGLGASRHRSSHATVAEAFAKYKEVKEGYIKHLATLYKDKIDNRAYVALLAYEVSIDD